MVFPSSILATPAAQNLKFMQSALIILAVIAATLIISSIVFTVVGIRSKKVSTFSGKFLLAMIYTTTVIVLVCGFLCLSGYQNARNTQIEAPTTAPTQTNPTTGTKPQNPPVTPPDDPVIDPPGNEEPEPPFIPSYTTNTNPNNWGIHWEIIQNGSIVDSYEREDKIIFGQPEDYTKLEGIITFRGDNYRTGPTYGTATVTNEVISKKWSKNIGTLNGWPGSGWTGQPLIVRWDDATKRIMNMYDEKKQKAGLVEVIYATLDGNIYFYDLDDGSYTRDPIYVGMNFKGAGSLDPRGYPLMYVGSGDYYNNESPKMYIISLIDGSILYERSGEDSFSLRPKWTAFDSSPLIDAETDTLIWPGENGILYTIKLNSRFDPVAGTVYVTPEDAVKTRYSVPRSNEDVYWLGYEPSAVIVDRYLYISENGGLFFCINLDNMQLVWAQDTKDDSNSTPVFQWEDDGNCYIYTAPSLHWTADKYNRGKISIYKLNAKNGEIVWEKSYSVNTVSGVSGGVQSTPLLGKPGTELEGMILYSIARTPNPYDGYLVALDTKTGKEVWKLYMGSYTWSSPAAVYTEDGRAYVVICDSAGNVRLLDGKTGSVLSTTQLGSNIEASPAVFENTVVVGTRGQKIYALKVS